MHAHQGDMKEEEEGEFGNGRDIDQALDNGAVMFSKTLSHVEDEYVDKAFSFTSVCPTGIADADPVDRLRMDLMRSSGRRSTRARRPSACITEQNQKQFFYDGDSRFTLRHVRLPPIVNLVFGFLRPEEIAQDFKVKSGPLDFGTLDMTKQALNHVRLRCKRLARKIINRPAFIWFMILLTFYALFGQDFVHAYGRQPIDSTFMILNTCAFFIFGIEVILMLLGRQDYLIVPFFLDVVAMLSILGDTWFLNSGSENEVQDRMAVARSSRMTRMTRVVRIARITRLVPDLMKLFGRSTMKFARTLMARKLWRVCIYLDTDHDGLLSVFDLKCFYLVVLESLRESTDCKPMLQSDIAILKTLCKPEEECAGTLRYETFIGHFLVTKAGQKVMQLMTLDIEEDSGVWTLTNKISDGIGLKICIGIVLLFITMELLSPNIKDISSEQVLAQLDQLTRSAIEQGWQNGYDDICEQVRKYMNNFNVLFLNLHGRTVVDGGGCVPQGLTIDKAPLDYVSDIIKIRELRISEVFRLCYPFREVCEVGYATSVSLIDNRQEARDNAQWTILQTSILIVLLLLSVLMFNHFLSSFTKTLVHPLRVMVDDMLTSSSLELLQLDMESIGQTMPYYKSPVTVVDELKYLEKAYKHMNQAVKAWSLYVPPAVVQCLLHASMEATIGMTRVECTVLFCDISNFDEVCGHLSAHDVLNKLSQILGKIADVIEANDGTLLEFIGDEVMAVFNAPNPLKLHPKVGVKAGIEIHQAIQKVAITEGHDGCEIIVKCQVGVHSAPILAGNVGSPQRMKYGLLGDGVNLSARLKGLNSKYGTKTLVTHKVLEDITNTGNILNFISRPIDRVAVKGRTEPTTVHEVLCQVGDKDTKELERLASIHKDAFRLYHDQLFKEALAIFSEVTKGFEEGLGNVRDEPSRQLAGRCQAYIVQPPPVDWDGVERLKAKSFQVPSVPVNEKLDLNAPTIEVREVSGWVAKDGVANDEVPADDEVKATSTNHLKCERTSSPHHSEASAHTICSATLAHTSVNNGNVRTSLPGSTSID